MTTVIHTTLDNKILTQWQELWEQSDQANYTNAPFWFVSVIKTFHFSDYAILGVYSHDQLVAVGGLVKTKKYGMSINSVAPEDFTYGIPFLVDIKNEKVMEELNHSLLSLGTVSFTNVPEEFVEKCKTQEKTATYQASNYYLDITVDTNNEVNIPNKKKLLQRAKPINDKLVMRSYNGFDKKTLAIAFRIDKKSSKKAAGYNAFSNQETAAFYTSLRETFQKYASLHILYHENKPIAYQLGFLIGKTFFCSQKAFDKNYRSYSIGRVLMIRMIEYFYSIGVTKVDFGSGEDEMKQSLTKTYRPLYSLVISKNNQTRLFLSSVRKTRDYLYNQLYKHKKVYILYNKGRNALFR